MKNTSEEERAAARAIFMTGAYAACGLAVDIVADGRPFPGARIVMLAHACSASGLCSSRGKARMGPRPARTLPMRSWAWWMAFREFGRIAAERTPSR